MLTGHPALEWEAVLPRTPESKTSHISGWNVTRILTSGEVVFPLVSSATWGSWTGALEARRDGHSIQISLNWLFRVVSQIDVIINLLKLRYLTPIHTSKEVYLIFQKKTTCFQARNLRVIFKEHSSLPPVQAKRSHPAFLSAPEATCASVGSTVQLAPILPCTPAPLRCPRLRWQVPTFSPQPRPCVVACRFKPEGCHMVQEVAMLTWNRKLKFCHICSQVLTSIYLECCKCIPPVGLDYLVLYFWESIFPRPQHPWK